MPVTLPPRDFRMIGPNEGDPFPAVELPDQTGARVDLHAARAGAGALVVVYRSADW
jgi:peroxiredoxin